MTKIYRVFRPRIPFFSKTLVLSAVLFMGFQAVAKDSHFSRNKQSLSKTIDKTVELYGGDKLTQLKRINIIESYNNFDYGQSFAPEEVDLLTNVFELSIDFAERRKSFQYVMGDKDEFSIRHWLFDGKDAYRVGYASKTVGKETTLSFEEVDRNHGLAIDTLLVKMLAENRDSAKWLNEKNTKVITFTALGNTAVSLYLDSKTGFVTKMSRAGWEPDKKFVYHFSNHTYSSGILHSKSTYITYAGQPDYVTLTRQLKVIDEQDVTFNGNFKLPASFGRVPETIDDSEMTVQQLADNVFLAGQEWGYTLFVDQGDYLVASGGYAGLTERYQAVVNKLEVQKPIKYQIVSHHHDDHMEGLSEAYKLGAKFVVANVHKSSVQSVIEQQLNDEHFVSIESFNRQHPKNMRVVDIANIHSSHDLLTYVIDSKILFSADIYFSRNKEMPPFGSAGLQKFNASLEKNDLNVEKFISSHSPKILSKSDFDFSMKNILTPVCPSTWKTCQMMYAR